MNLARRQAVHLFSRLNPKNSVSGCKPDVLIGPLAMGMVLSRQFAALISLEGKTQLEGEEGAVNVTGTRYTLRGLTRTPSTTRGGG